ncbi:uncharacterized protein MONBRDRAFT_22366 [Monosiga brevicollis MX1]|uniref:Conserved oligomeric Golgi complex subunit 8 n=1 Tax=Monosiga brevicollis TaxID=81824 RepID=A9UQD3_MONBE|nr:uncharacterized protein MONBRDRAFT_22366 [Monosiga brevicollis MX1]EDQ92578.1 predicted protein [Monosiga brevicollis MX1]|eukprot:XP_001742340.1 hypothetical protein [Monosiga brevicollis MX1]
MSLSCTFLSLSLSVSLCLSLSLSVSLCSILSNQFILSLCLSLCLSSLSLLSVSLSLSLLSVSPLSLFTEQQTLRDSLTKLSQDTEELAWSHYKSFISAADHSKAIFREFKAVEDHASSLSNQLSGLSGACTALLQQAKAINDQRHEAALMLRYHSQIMEVLELPHLLDACIKSSRYEKALELRAHIQRLARKLSNVSVIKTIAEQSELRMGQMKASLVQALQTDLALTDCINTVSHLRALQTFQEPELRVLFLQARNAFLDKTLASLSTADAARYLNDVMDASRRHIFNIVTQYGAVFSTTYASSSKTHDPLQRHELLYDWALFRVTIFVATLEQHLPRVQARAAAIMGQAMQFMAALRRCGMNGRALLLPVCERYSINAFEARVRAAIDIFETGLPSMRLAAHGILNVDASFDESDLLQPQLPIRLTSHGALASLANAILHAFNELREFALASIAIKLAEGLTVALQRGAASLARFYEGIKSGLTQKEMLGLKNIMSLYGTALVPALVACFDAIYMPSLFLDRAALATMRHQSLLSIEAIVSPLCDACPETVGGMVRILNGTATIPSEGANGSEPTAAGAEDKAPASEAELEPTTEDSATESEVVNDETPALERRAAGAEDKAPASEAELEPTTEDSATESEVVNDETPALEPAKGEEPVPDGEAGQVGDLKPSTLEVEPAESEDNASQRATSNSEPSVLDESAFSLDDDTTAEVGATSPNGKLEPPVEVDADVDEATAAIDTTPATPSAEAADTDAYASEVIAEPESVASPEASHLIPKPAAVMEDVERDRAEQVFADWLEAMRAHMQQDHLRVLDLFRECDVNGDGRLSADELRQFLTTAHLPMSNEDVTCVMGVLDEDGSGLIDYHEFAQKVYRRRYPATESRRSSASSTTAPEARSAPSARQSAGETALNKLLKYFQAHPAVQQQFVDEIRAKDSTEQTGAVSRQAFRSIVRKLEGAQVSIRDANAMIAYLDPDNTMKVVYEELAPFTQA